MYKRKERKLIVFPRKLWLRHNNRWLQNFTAWLNWCSICKMFNFQKKIENFVTSSYCVITVAHPWYEGSFAAAASDLKFNAINFVCLRLDVNKRDYRAWYGLGQTYELLKMPFYCLYYYKQAQELRPSDSRMLVALGESYEKLDKLPVSCEQYWKRKGKKDKYNPSMQLLFEGRMSEFGCMYSSLFFWENVFLFCQLFQCYARGL